MTEENKSGFEKIGRAAALYPQEKQLKRDRKAKSLSIGLPLEKGKQENRISLKPESVKVLIQNDHQVIVEAE